MNAMRDFGYYFKCPFELWVERRTTNSTIFCAKWILGELSLCIGKVRVIFTPKNFNQKRSNESSKQRAEPEQSSTEARTLKFRDKVRTLFENHREVQGNRFRNASTINCCHFKGSEASCPNQDGRDC